MMILRSTISSQKDLLAFIKIILFKEIQDKLTRVRTASTLPKSKLLPVHKMRMGGIKDFSII